MRNLTEDVLAYLDTNEIPEQWFVNDLGTKEVAVNPDFIEEMDIQIQINETESNTTD